MGKSNSQRTQEELIQMAQLYFPGGSTGNNTPPHLLINQGSLGPGSILLVSGGLSDGFRTI